MMDSMEYNDKEIQRIISETQKLKTPDFDETQAWENIVSKTGLKKTIKLNSRKILKYAAVIIFGLVVGFLVSQSYMLNGTDKFVEINARKGQKIEISLPDGNKIWINSNSSIKYPANFEEFNKKIYVQGEMYFDFSENTLSPVFVIVNDVVIQGFNSAFNVKTSADNESAEITVTKGWISVNNPKVDVSDLTVEKGYTCFFSDDLPLFIEESNNANFLAWKTGQLHFKDTPLKVVAETLSDYYEIAVQVDGRIGYCNFTSDYNNTDIETILRDIQEALKPSVHIKNTKIIIKGGDC